MVPLLFVSFLKQSHSREQAHERKAVMPESGRGAFVETRRAPRKWSSRVGSLRNQLASVPRSGEDPLRTTYWWSSSTAVKTMGELGGWTQRHSHSVSRFRA